MTVERALDALDETLARLREESRDRRLPAVARAASEVRAAIERDRLRSAPVPRDRLAEVVSAVLAACPPRLPETADALVHALMQATGAPRGFFLLAEPDRRVAEVVATRSYPGHDLSLAAYDPSRTIVGEALRSLLPVRLDDAATSDLKDETSVRAHGLRSVLAVPLVSDGRALGVVYLENDALAGAFSEADAAVAVTASRLVVELLRAARLLPWAFRSSSRPLVEAGPDVELLGEDPSMQELRRLLARVASSHATVLLEGETGTGKELAARALHALSPRRDRPFVAVNCAAIPDTLLESELFGHERGAYTGATERALGRLERADGGTVFLDEVSELPSPVQAKLLRFLQSGEIDRLGGRETRKVDVRVVAATSRGLLELVAQGRFHDALYYRLNVIPIVVPPLRERGDDVRRLAEAFFDRFGALYGRRLSVQPAVFAALGRHPFPGNVRELENLVHRIVVLAASDVVTTADLPHEIAALAQLPLDKEPDGPARDLPALRRRRERLLESVLDEEAALARQAVEAADGNVTRAAKSLGLHRATLHRLLARHARRPSR